MTAPAPRIAPQIRPILSAAQPRRIC